LPGRSSRRLSRMSLEDGGFFADFAGLVVCWFSGGEADVADSASAGGSVFAADAVA